MRTDLRTEGRYFVVTPLPAEIEGANADLIDLSTRGARLQLTERVEVGRRVALTLRSEDAAINTSASVVWCDVAALALHDEESDRFFCGITFDRSLSVIRHLIDDLLTARAVIPIEECRLTERYRVMVPLTASFGDLGSLRVLDLSIRGARIMTPALLEAGSSGRLRFTINGRDTHVWLPATVIWSRPAQRKGRFETGLRILEGEDWLRTVIDELSLRDGVAIETDSLRHKFDPFASRPVSGLVTMRR